MEGMVIKRNKDEGERKNEFETREVDGRWDCVCWSGWWVVVYVGGV